MKIIAIDWSGATSNARNRIWLAECDAAGHPLRLECGRDRNEISNYLRSLQPAPTIIGFDFAFSFPMWFLQDLGITNAPDLWDHVSARGESWLTLCDAPFWGRGGRRRPPSTQPEFRHTEASVPRTAGIAPKSVFQIGGAGAVGTGSIRGMPILHDLYRSGARIWPFTPGGFPVVVEIYPRLLTGPVRKSRSRDRVDLLTQRYPRLGPAYLQAATESEDAFDALVSALVMSEHVDDLLNLPEVDDPALRAEGRIWHPRWRDDVRSGT